MPIYEIEVTKIQEMGFSLIKNCPAQKKKMFTKKNKNLKTESLLRMR